MLHYVSLGVGLPTVSQQGPHNCTICVTAQQSPRKDSLPANLSFLFFLSTLAQPALRTFESLERSPIPLPILIRAVRTPIEPYAHTSTVETNDNNQLLCFPRSNQCNTTAVYKPAETVSLVYNSREFRQSACRRISSNPQLTSNLPDVLSAYATANCVHINRVTAATSNSREVYKLYTPTTSCIDRFLSSVVNHLLPNHITSLDSKQVSTIPIAMASQAQFLTRRAPILQLSPVSSTSSLSDGLDYHDELVHLTKTDKLSVGDIPDDRLADTLALVLNEFCKSSSTCPSFPDPSDPAALFFSPDKQITFTLNFYCKRLLAYTCCSKSCFVIAVLYLVRLAKRCPIFELNEYNVHRLICTSVVLSAKWLDDVSYSNAHYAKVGGIQSAAEMSKLEEHMLRALDYRVFITKENFEEVENHIILMASNCI